MAQSFAQKSSLAFNLALVFILSAAGLLAFFFLKIYEKIRLYLPVLTHKIQTACDCQLTQLTNDPYTFIGLGLLGLGAVFFLLFSLYKLGSLFIRTKKYSSRHLKSARAGLSGKLSQAVAETGVEAERVVEVENNDPAVFCFGIWKTKICVSSGLVEMLAPEELKAVLWHEWHHLKSRDPLKFFILKYFQSVLFFLPGMRGLIKKYVTLSELAADARATNDFADKIVLARAIYKITQKEESDMLQRGLALSFFSSVIAERVNRLCDDNYAPRFNVFGKGFIIGASSIIAASFLLFVFLTGGSAGQTVMPSSGCGLQKQNFSSNSACQAEIFSGSCAKQYSGHQSCG